MNSRIVFIKAELALLCFTLTACGNPEQKFSIKALDDKGDPIEHLECKAWFKLPGNDGATKDYSVSGQTDANGNVELTGQTIWGPTIVEAHKDGYYPSMYGNHWTISRTEDNRWEPWPIEVKFVMKEIINPKPMYVVSGKREGRFLLPDNLKGPIGFDLIQRDWVAPHGKGVVADFVLEGFDKTPDDKSSGEGWMRLTFPNEGDGIQPLSTENDGGSLLMGPHEAPERGYFSEWNFPNFPTSAEESLNPVKSSAVHAFRVRTKLDQDGNVIETFYGKIHNGIYYVFSEHASIIRMTYYLNQNENERGLEWDMKNNLFEDIKSSSPHRP